VPTRCLHDYQLRVRLRRPDDAGHIGRRGGQRFLDEHVFPGRNRVDEEVGMQVGRRRDDHPVDGGIPEDLPVVAGAAGDAELAGRSFRRRG